jgi:NAD(P)-dependent dehydrogenase (short-subunit alcohol dehydrogenase family)
VDTKKPVALITGASSGFGRETAKALAQRSWQVFGTSRQTNPEKNDFCQMLTLDVRDDNSVSNCVEQILHQTPRIDLLVNNAGFGIYCFAEETDLQQAQDIFQTNLFGTARMTNAILPTMRKQRHGRIINVGSLGGLIAMPYRAFYSATKFALEGYTESLSYELAPFNIKISIVEPGFFRTALHQNMLKSTGHIPQYDIIRTQLDKYFGKGLRRTGNPAKVANLIANIAQTKSPKLRYRIGPYSTLMPCLKTIMSQKLYTWCTRRWFKVIGKDNQMNEK